uniref:EF-hand domain-containing protein n=1 Tax=Chromera velia CCMP2878 TaxID=1169474 RepID=A0A0G4HRM8_9ALVE|eukprot:Cvel_30679.t1-p1 / transcript=Cvel_30679.t1 / gene=Cvel_30679 / organism=Chromera_velia_CCMP2878 / gene_product=hypothetical protein / transcript_product=hypothetical protein / location=Cvel_scaffold4421:1889-5445(-) / protein_length=442 / sequence_SO=supercontig / SO=protein_coding / is_pseudo=false
MGSALPVAQSPIVEYIRSEFDRCVYRGDADHLDEKQETGGEGGPHSSSTNRSTEGGHYRRVGLKKKDVLFLEDIRCLKPPSGVELDLNHIPTLYALDSSHDGCLDWDELLEFSEFCNELKRVYGREHEYKGRLQALCTMSLLDQISTEGGMGELIEWICDLIRGPQDFVRMQSESATAFLTYEELALLHGLLRAEDFLAGFDLQGFVQLLQHSSECEGEGHRPSASSGRTRTVASVVTRFLRQVFGEFSLLAKELFPLPPRPHSGFAGPNNFSLSFPPSPREKPPLPPAMPVPPSSQSPSRMHAHRPLSQQALGQAEREEGRAGESSEGPVARERERAAHEGALRGSVDREGRGGQSQAGGPMPRVQGRMNGAGGGEDSHVHSRVNRPNMKPPTGGAGAVHMHSIPLEGRAQGTSIANPGGVQKAVAFSRAGRGGPGADRQR